MIQDDNIASTARVSTETLTFFVPGALTVTEAAAIRVRLPYAARIRRVFLSAQTVSGTTPTLSATLKDATAATTLVTTADITTSDTPLLTTADVPIPANDDLTIDLTIAGTTPSFSNLTVQVTVEKCDPRDVSGTADGVTW